MRAPRQKPLASILPTPQTSAPQSATSDAHHSSCPRFGSIRTPRPGNMGDPLFPPSTMSLASSVHDIQSLILSFHPVIVVETTEEERLRTTSSRWPTRHGSPSLSGP